MDYIGFFSHLIDKLNRATARGGALRFYSTAETTSGETSSIVGASSITGGGGGLLTTFIGL